MLKSITKLTRKVAFTAALLAGVAGFASTANAAVSAVTTAGSTFNLQAPFTTQFVAAYGQNVRLNLTRNGTAGNSDYMRLYAFLYLNGSYVGNVASAASTGTGAAALQQVVTLPNTPGAYNQVTFAYIFTGEQADITQAADDTLNAAAANVTVLKVVPGATRTAATLSAATVPAYTTTSASAAVGNVTAGELNAIGADSDIVASPVSVVSSAVYAGPVLTTVTKQAASNPLDMRLTFDTALVAIGDNTDLDAKVQVQVGAVDASDTGAVLTKGAVSAGDYSFKIDDQSSAFNGAVDNVDILSGGALITDEAGNPAVASADFSTITVYSAPAFAASGTAKVLLTGGNAVDTNPEKAELNSTTGTGNVGETFIFTVRMAENFDGTGVDNVDDIVVTPAAADTATTVTSSGAGASTFTFTITLANEIEAIRVNPTTGVLEWTSADNVASPTWTPITFGLTVGAGALTTADGGVLTTANTPVSTYNSLLSTNLTYKTDDRNADGVLDGVTVDFVEDIGTVTSTGFSIFDRVTPATTATTTVVAHASDASQVHITGTQATIVSMLETGQTSSSHLNTAATSATPIPYDFSLTAGTTTYARVYNATTGALRTVADIAAGQTITDGAGPAVLSASRTTGPVNDPEGTLSIVFSEAVQAGATQANIKTNNGSLAFDILNNVDDGGAASATGALSTTTLTNDTITFSDVDNDVITALTAVGVTAGNTTVQDAAGNLAGEQTVTPSAATAITTVAPTFDKAVVVVNSSGFITNVLVFLTENVTLTGSTTDLAARFSLSFDPAGAPPAIALSPSAAAVSSNVVNLTLPGSGISLRQFEGGSATVTYTTAAGVSLTDTDANALATFGPSAIDLPANTSNLFSMEVRGTVYTTGTTPVAQGTLVRADLVRFDNTRVVDRGTVTVPCNCAGNTKDVALGSFAGIDQAIIDAGVRNETSFTAYVRVTHDGAGTEQGTGVSATLHTTNPGASGQQTVYTVSINRTSGAITSSGSSVTGQLFFRNGPISMTSLDSARYAVVNATDGKFRLNVGTNYGYTSGDTVVLISVRQNGSTTSSWVPVTFADASLTGYLPFNADVRTTVAAGVSDSPFIDFENLGGGNGLLTAVFDLSKIASTDLADSTSYQLVGLKGQLLRNSSALNDFKAYRFFTTINTDTGAPYMLWSFNGTNTEAFTLMGNAVKSSFTLGNVNIENIKNSVVSGSGIAYQDVGNTVTVTNRDTVFYPVSAATATSTSLSGGWHLITVQADQASPGFLGNTSTDNTAVGMIIEAGARRNGDGAGAVRSGVRTWIRGTTDNSLTSLEAGKAYFVYLNAADSTWTGQ